jgi:hypothetical protein
MIARILRGARRLDAALADRLGPAYNAILAIGLVIEIGRRIREMGEIEHTGAVRVAVTILFFAILLLHQLGELSEHVERRRERAHQRTEP